MAGTTRRQRRKQKVHEKKPILPMKVEKEKPDYSPSHKKTKFFGWYDKNLTKLMIIPSLMLVFAIVMIVVHTVTTGSFISRGIGLTGGQTITITDESLDTITLEAALISTYPNADIIVRVLSEYGEQRGLIIESSLDAPAEDIMNIVGTYSPAAKDNYSVETIGASLSEGFFKEVMIALLVAFIFMSIVVFILFRTFWPSLAIIAAALSDMIFSVGIIDLFGIKLGTAGIAALLMLIGYSVDTDILLTTRLLKAKRGDYLERTKSAMRTGLTMTATALVVVTVGLIASESDVLKQIFTILLIGLVADLFFTWIQNVAILWFYLKKKGLKK